MSTENWQLVSNVFTQIINMGNEFDFEAFLSHLQEHNHGIDGIEDSLKSAEGSTTLMKTLTIAIVIYYLKLRGVLDPNFLQFARDNMRVYATGNWKNTQEAYLCRRAVGFLESLDLQYGEEFRLRIIAKGSSDHLDTVEHLFLKMEYGNEPLLNFSSDGSFCKVQLNEEKTKLRSSISELFQVVRDMAKDLPPLDPSNEPILYIGMKKTPWAPEGFIAPYFPDYTYLRPALLYSSPWLRSWTVYDAIHEKLKAHSGVNTGYHLLKSSLVHKQGHFTSSELFVKSYAGAAARCMRH